MGEAKRRGTFKERQAVAVEREKHIQAEADRLFAEWQAKQEKPAVIDAAVEDEQPRQEA